MEEERDAYMTCIDVPYGACSICGACEIVLIGKQEFGACFTHRIWWSIGSNNTKLHHAMTMEGMRARAARLHGFREAGWLRPGEKPCDWDGPVAAKWVEEWFAENPQFLRQSEQLNALVDACITAAFSQLSHDSLRLEDVERRVRELLTPDVPVAALCPENYREKIERRLGNKVQAD